MDERLLKVVVGLNNQYKKPMIISAADVALISRLRLHNVAINWCCTGGGVPMNRIIELYGPESSGKTKTAIELAAELQKMEWSTHTPRAIEVHDYKERLIKVKDSDATYKMYLPGKVTSIVKGKPKIKTVVLIDVEGTYDPYFGAQLGVDNKLLLHVIPETAEQAVDIADAYLRDPDISGVIFDSVGVARAAAEVDKSMEDQVMGTQARFWNRAAVKFQAATNNNPEQDVTLVLINRAYTKIGLVFGDPEEIGGGSGLRFAKAISLKFHPMKKVTEKIDGQDIIVGRHVEVQNKKNKTGKPFRTAQFYYSLIDDDVRGLKYGEVDRVACILELALINGLIDRSGSHYKYQRVKVNGREDFEEYLRTHPGITDAIEEKLYQL